MNAVFRKDEDEEESSQRRRQTVRGKDWKGLFSHATNFSSHLESEFSFSEFLEFR
jgi:hypothetical protein